MRRGWEWEIYQAKLQKVRPIVAVVQTLIRGGKVTRSSFRSLGLLEEGREREWEWY